MEPVFFATPALLRQWLEAHYKSAAELWVGFYKVGSGRESITWPQSVDEALCFGWIDGIRKTIDASSYVIRFTPRKPKSIWSAVNIAKMEALIKAGRVTPEGLAAYEKREAHRSAIYSFEQGEVALDPEFEKAFRANRKAWKYFEAQPPYYRKVATWWVISAKTEATRRRRMDALIDDSENGRYIPSQRRPGGKK